MIFIFFQIPNPLIQVIFQMCLKECVLIFLLLFEVDLLTFKISLDYLKRVQQSNSRFIFFPLILFYILFHGACTRKKIYLIPTHLPVGHHLIVNNIHHVFICIFYINNRQCSYVLTVIVYFLISIKIYVQTFLYVVFDVGIDHIFDKDTIGGIKEIIFF